MAPWSRAAALLVVLCGLQTASSLRAVRNAVTPIEKVINLLTDLEARVSEEGAKEAAEYDKYACFCKNTADAKTAAIDKSDEKIKELEALISELDSDITSLDAKAVKLTGEIKDLNEKVKDEKEDRAAEREEYEIADANVTQAIDSVDRAIEALKASKGDTEGAKLDLAQVAQKVVDKVPSAAQAKEVATLVQASKQDPASYEYRSNDIIAVLESLSVQFKNRAKVLYEEDFDAQAIHDKKVLGWNHEIKAKEKAKRNAEMTSSKKTEEMEKATAEKTGETEAMNADTDFRTELTKECENRAKEFDQRSKARSSEITALSEAKQTLKDGAAANYEANKKLTGLSAVKTQVAKPEAAPAKKAVAAKKALSLLQLGSSNSNAKAIMERAMSRLSELATKLDSSTLSAVAVKAEMLGIDHFVKVRGIIKDLIQRLEEEKIAEASQKSFCDVEMAEVLSNRDKFNLQMEEQAAKIQMKTSFIDATKKEIADLSKEVAELSKALNEATQLRQEEKAENEKTIADSSAGFDAVKSALATLKEFYGGSAEFLQQPNADREGKTLSDRAPKMSYSGDYKGAQDSSKGIIGLLEVIMSDFERTETTVTNEEKDAVTDFEKYEEDTKEDVKSKKKLISDKEDEINAAEEAIVTAKDDKVKAERLHGDALSELEKLKPMCVAQEESYEERRKKRMQEIEALKEAHKILEEWQD